MLFNIEAFSVVMVDEEIDVEEFTDGHNMNVPIKPPYKLMLYPL